MTSGTDPRALLRWYPQAWREQHGEVLVGTFEEIAAAEGRSGLGRGDAWSVRVHGAAERLSLRAGAALALAALVATTTGLVLVMSGVGERTAAASAATLLLFGVGPGLTSLGALALVRDMGRTTAGGTVLGAVAAVAAWSVGGAAAGAWSVGFDRADAGLPLGSFASAFPLLLVAALLLGAVALLPSTVGALRGMRPPALRRVLAAAAALALAPVLALGTLAVGGVLAAACAVLVLCLLRARPRGPFALTATATATAPAVRAGAPGAHRPGVVVSLAASGGALSLAAAVYALRGEEPVGWLPSALSGLPAMNVGLALGTLTTLPVICAAGLALHPRLGRTALPAAGLLAVAALLRAWGAVLGTDGDLGTALVLGAGVVAGWGVALAVSHRLPGRPASRAALLLLIGLTGGWLLMVPLVAAMPFVAPIAAAVVVLAMTRARRRNRPTAGHAVASAQVA